MAAKAILIPRSQDGPVSFGRCLATTAGGTEHILARELEEIGATVLDRYAGAVAFRGTAALLVRANRQLRTASRVLVSLFREPVRSDRDIYDRVAALPWEVILPTSVTLAVAATSSDATMRDGRFLALRVKDAIVDRQRSRQSGKRSSVDRRDPGLRVVLHVEARGRETVAELSLDSSLRPLHERGYRLEAGEAPLRETVAAAMLLEAGWRPQDPRPLIDPFCGSGTIAIEAAMIRRGMPPGALGTRGYGYERWGWFEAPPIEAPQIEAPRFEAPRIKAPEPEDAVRPDGARARPVTANRTSTPIVCADVDPRIVAVAQRNAQRAGVEREIEFVVSDVRDLVSALRNAGYTGIASAAGTGIVVTNPPYGARLTSTGIDELYGDFGRLLKQDFAGWEVVTLTEDRRDAPRIGLRPHRRLPIYNGSIACVVSRYGLYDSTSG